MDPGRDEALVLCAQPPAKQPRGETDCGASIESAWLRIPLDVLRNESGEVIRRLVREDWATAAQIADAVTLAAVLNETRTLPPVRLVAMQ